MNNGKEFESLVESIYRELDPNSIITKNDKIWGARSNTKRQIDLSIRAKLGGVHSVLLIVQAKDHSIPLDVNVVGEFASVIEDVGAAKGILISSKGFTQAARSFALSQQIDLLTAHDTKKPKWKAKLSIPVVLTSINGTFQPSFNFTANQDYVDRVAKGAIPQPRNMYYRFTPDKGRTVIIPIDDFRNKYYQGELTTDGDAQHLAYPDMDLIVEEGLFVPASEIRFDYTLQKTVYHKDFELKEFKGFVDGINNEPVSVHYKIETEELTVEDHNVTGIKAFSLKTWSVLSDPRILNKPFKVHLLHLPQLQTDAKSSFKFIGNRMID